jgi:hypothetical protein
MHPGETSSIRGKGKVPRINNFHEVKDSIVKKYNIHLILSHAHISLTLSFYSKDCLLKTQRPLCLRILFMVFPDQWLCSTGIKGKLKLFLEAAITIQ